MASNFILAQEVINIAFEKADIRTGYIKDNHIEVSEIKYIRPAITEDLFNHLDKDDGGLEEHEVTLKAIIKKALAHYVAYLVIPGMSTQVSNLGAQRSNGLHSNSASDKQIGELRSNHMAMGDAYKDEAVKYIEDNLDSFSEYYQRGQSTNNKVKIRGGIIF